MRPLESGAAFFLPSGFFCFPIGSLHRPPPVGITENTMVSIRLPDGSVRQYDHPVTVAEVAASIGAGLAKAALAGKLNGELVDTSFVIDRDSSLAIVTDKDPEGVDVVRHSTAHLLAYAVKDLFPEAQ